ncbi:nitrogen fixation protein NIFU [Mycoplasmopsis canis UF31]|uniref:iron-sulfur cluster assembly scaffold protein n=1 Tax=Mycoplasmopsis canis TaxID=29555 RepID=UPI00025AD9EB|nr:iron-sulfur cluster assembly scaffold protein [Mycoplasmopsis canis]EIE39659.1 nitrogen fixation protein NIFU [Mycoplasmopsis canis UF31]
MHFNPNEARELIMKHYRYPDNKQVIEGESITSFSNTCADKLELKLEFDNNILANATFNGIGCAVFLSSTDILLNVLEGKTKEEVKLILDIYEKFLDEQELSNEEIDRLQDLWVFFNVKKHLSRMSCALLTSNTIKNEIK